jgi:hypothetical protein
MSKKIQPRFYTILKTVTKPLQNKKTTDAVTSNPQARNTQKQRTLTKRQDIRGFEQYEDREQSLKTST